MALRRGRMDPVRISYGNVSNETGTWSPWDSSIVSCVSLVRPAVVVVVVIAGRLDQFLGLPDDLPHKHRHHVKSLAHFTLIVTARFHFRSFTVL